MQGSQLAALKSRRSRPVFGIQFCRASRLEIANAVCDTLPEIGSGANLLVTTNLHHVVILRRSPEFSQAYDNAFMATIDGAPVLAYAWLRGANPAARVTGSDLCPEIMQRLSPGRHRPFFVTSTIESAQKLRRWLVGRKFSDEEIGFFVPPYGFEGDGECGARLAESIRTLGTTHLFMGVGCPKSELWAHRHRFMLGDLYVFCFGAGLDFFAGTRPRAPSLFRKLGFEWMWRFLQEPKRLFRRYIIDSWGFFGAIADDVRFGGYRVAQHGRDDHPRGEY
jgi:N-acetylglucosaminyldiphosphoundecaprenol N-acetyl-beta-D-mannosaminyltransferase